MEYLSKAENEKIDKNIVSDIDRQFIKILKLFKLNHTDGYRQFTQILEQEEIEYIESLIGAREGQNIDSIDQKVGEIVRKKLEKYINAVDAKLLKDFKIIIWEAQ